MALSAPVLSAAIRANLLADAGTGALNNAALTKVCDAIAAAVVAHITAAGVVNVVTACGAGAGTGTGTVS
jgi:hypothetical protein